MQRSYLDYAMSRHRRRARCPTCATASSRCTAACSTRCTTAATGPTAASPSARASSATSWASYHPHGDSAIYDALVRLAQPWSLRYPLVDGQRQLRLARQRPGRGHALHRVQDGAAGHGDGARHRRGDRRLHAELRRPHAGAVVLPRRFPNLLVNGSAGIAVGMATNIPPHNLREVAERRAVVPGATPRPSREELLEALHRADQGPGLPDRRADRRPQGHRGRLPHRPRLDHDARGRRGRGGSSGRTCLVVTELPYQVNPDNLALKIADLVKDGKIAGIADVRDELLGAPASAWSSCSSATRSPRSC